MCIRDRVSRITFELDRRIIKSFYAGRYWWESFPNNWAAVCAGSVGITFLYERPELFYAVKPRIDGAMKTFLSSYKSDGVCREGLGYWNYGFGYFCYYAAHLRTFSDGTDNLLALPQVKTIAKFQQQMFLKGSVTVSFADGADNSSYIPVSYTHLDVYKRQACAQRLGKGPAAGIAAAAAVCAGQKVRHLFHPFVFFHFKGFCGHTQQNAERRAHNS